jgi:phage-related tail fiber protein
MSVSRSSACMPDATTTAGWSSSSPHRRSPLSGLQTIDAVAVLAGDTVLVTAQTDAKTNGVYLASAGAWTRDASADEGIDLPPGTTWFIKAGSDHTGSLWRLQNSDVPVINNDALSIQRVRLPVRTVATAPITLSALQTINGVALAAGDRVLVTAQTTSSQNGVYLASSGAWTRATPENVAAGMKDGSMWFISAGSHAGQYWRLNGDATPGASKPHQHRPGHPQRSLFRHRTNASLDAGRQRNRSQPNRPHENNLARHDTACPCCPLWPMHGILPGLQSFRPGLWWRGNR